MTHNERAREWLDRNYAAKVPLPESLASEFAAVKEEGRLEGGQEALERAAQEAKAAFGCPEGCGDYIAKRILRLSTPEARSALADSPSKGENDEPIP